jgi:DNA-binding transcriptional LysR family regulator
MDRIARMKAFTRVVEAGGFSAAAEQLGLSRAIVSKAVLDLERDLGARLLERTTRRVNVNEIGLAYYEKCVRILADLEEADRSVQQLHDEPRGILRVTAPVSFSLLHMKTVITAYLTQYPDVSLSLTLNDRFVDLIDEGYDVAIRITRLDDSSMIARHIAPAKRVLCAAPSYLQKHGIPETPADLIRHQCLGYGASVRPDEWTLVGPDGARTIRVSGPLSSNNGDLLACAARDGLGITLLPTFIIGGDVASNALTVVLPEHRPTDIGIYAVYPPNRHLAAKVRTFIDILTKHFNPQPPWERTV